MSTVKAKNIKVPNSAGTLEATLSFDGVNVVSDKPINADIKPSLNATGIAPVYGCRAWVNFDGTKDSTGAVSTANTARFIRASGNVTSVVRNGTGDYTVNFTVAMPDANYSWTFGTRNEGTAGASDPQGHVSVKLGTTPAASSITIRSGVVGVAADNPFVCVNIFR
jgi:hypothetical protein